MNESELEVCSMRSLSPFFHGERVGVRGASAKSVKVGFAESPTRSLRATPKLCFGVF